MKQIILMALAVCAMTAALQAAPLNCNALPGATFQDLENAGSCVIGDKLYSNFSLTPNAIGGACQIEPAVGSRDESA